jgi:hypothetical protein
MRIRQHAVSFLLAATALVAVPCCWEVAGAATSRPTLDAVIRKLSTDTIPSRKEGEKILGVKLKPDGGSNFYDFLKSPSRLLADTRLVSIDFRTPKPGAETTGPVLILNVDNSKKRCIDRSLILKQYSRLALASAPSPNSVNSTTDYSSPETWGRFSVGFSQQSPNCLAFVVFDYLFRD